MGNLIQILLASIKAKITPIWTKIKLFTNWNFLKTRVFTKIRQGFILLFGIKPKDKSDYFGVGRWLISKKLCFSIAIVLGLLSLYYLVFVNPPSIFLSASDGIKTYSYNSLPLRFKDGTVRIKAKSGYVAYEGEVKSGEVVGKGTLFDKNGKRVYEGAFSGNKFNGKGILFYPDEQIHYSGEFTDNLFNGSGKLYRENGSLEYDGEFFSGMKNGEGILFDKVGNQIFTGNFSMDSLMYTDLLGISTGNVFEQYTGSREVYMDDRYMAVNLKDIDCLFYGYMDSNTLSGEVPVEGLYVLDTQIKYNGTSYDNIFNLQDAWDAPVYQGNTYILMPEAVVISLMNQKGVAFTGDPDCRCTRTLDDVITVDSFNSNYSVYIYSFVNDGIRYTFFCKDKSGSFYTYLMELVE